MSFSAKVRFAHRWLSILFTLTVIANFVAMIFGPPPASVSYAPLAPLFLMLVSGLYMFFRPYLTRSAAQA